MAFSVLTTAGLTINIKTRLMAPDRSAQDRLNQWNWLDSAGRDQPAVAPPCEQSAPVHPAGGGATDPADCARLRCCYWHPCGRGRQPPPLKIASTLSPAGVDDQVAGVVGLVGCDHQQRGLEWSGAARRLPLDPTGAPGVGLRHARDAGAGRRGHSSQLDLITLLGNPGEQGGDAVKAAAGQQRPLQLHGRIRRQRRRHEGVHGFPCGAGDLVTPGGVALHGVPANLEYAASLFKVVASSLNKASCVFGASCFLAGSPPHCRKPALGCEPASGDGGKSVVPLQAAWHTVRSASSSGCLLSRLTRASSSSRIEASSSSPAGLGSGRAALGGSGMSGTAVDRQGCCQQCRQA